MDHHLLATTLLRTGGVCHLHRVGLARAGGGCARSVAAGGHTIVRLESGFTILPDDVVAPGTVLWGLGQRDRRA